MPSWAHWGAGSTRSSAGAQGRHALEHRGVLAGVLVLGSTRGSGARQQASHFPLVSSCQTRFEDSIRVGAADSSGAGVLLAPCAHAAREPDESRKQRKGGEERRVFGKGGSLAGKRKREKKARNADLGWVEGWLETQVVL